MRPLLSPEEMARADRATVDGGTPITVLMERAGAAIAAAAIRLGGGRYGKKVVIVCGKGNNGGDGIAAARILQREGVGVRCLLLAASNDYHGAARDHLDQARRAGVMLRPFNARRLERADVVVDAIFGTGFRGSPKGDHAAAIEAINDSPAAVVAVDIPSGVDGATGRVEGVAVRAAVTVVMAAEKIGTAVGPGAVHAGRIEIADIGIAIDAATMWASDADDVARALPVRPSTAHKRNVGSVALLVGSDEMTGAALLTARGAERMGAGYVSLGVTPATAAAKAAVLPEVLSTIVTDSPVLGPEALARFSSVIERAGAVATGPGLGWGDEQRSLVEEVLAKVDLPVVLDADALNVLADDTSPLEQRSAPALITPHPGEMARLLNASTSEVQDDRVGAARAAADRFDCVVLFKGFRTVVTEPSGRLVVNTTGGAELATAGSGDVLTGAIAALLAAGVEPFAAAWAAAYVHGLAGKVAAAEAGGSGVVAWDVAEALPEAAALVRATAP